MTEPRELAQLLEEWGTLPPGEEERFAGYGVMGLPFSSGHILGLRRFTASSVGPPYTTVWHRAPDGRWTIYSDVDCRYSCPRYFGAQVARSVETPIELEWKGPRTLSVAVPSASFTWESTISSNAMSRAMSFMAGAMPDALWRASLVLDALGLVSGPALRAGRLAMRGTTPNRQGFVVNPRRVWLIEESRAVLDGEPFGELGPVTPQAFVGDFAIPQRGIFAVGASMFESFDATKHDSRLTSI